MYSIFKSEKRNIKEHSISICSQYLRSTLWVILARLKRLKMQLPTDLHYKNKSHCLKYFCSQTLDYWNFWSQSLSKTIIHICQWTEKQLHLKGNKVFTPHWQIFVLVLSINTFTCIQLNTTSYLHLASEVTVSWFQEV